MATSDAEIEVHTWLKTALVAENLDNFSIEIQENTAKGAGYLGDMVFVHLTGKTSTGQVKKYDLILKCAKRGAAVREKTPVKDAFHNEIYVYSEIFPAFVRFQEEKGVKEVFRSVAKSFGSYVSESMEVLVLQNLKKIGYDLWDSKRPLSRKHIEMVLREYGKFHGISAAMQDQKPKEFQKLAGGLRDLWLKLNSASSTHKIFNVALDQTCSALKDDLDQKSFEQLRSFGDEIDKVTKGLHVQKSFKVVLHRDCWNNNFMFKSENGSLENPTEVAMLDWQISTLGSPALDLSYFLFTCISESDLQDIYQLLGLYYDSFSKNVRMLGSNPEKIYPFSELAEEWKKFAKHGLAMAFLVIKICLTQKEDVSDISDAVEKGRDFTDTFAYEVKNKELYRERVKYLVEYAIERKLF